MILTYNALINNSLIDHTKLTLGNSEKLTYYIDQSIGLINLNRFPVVQYGTIQSDDVQIYSLGHETLYYDFIKSTLNRLDEIIDLDFEEMLHNNGSQIDIYNVSYSSNFNYPTIGEALAQRSQSGSWWDLFWSDSKLNGELNINSNKNTIIHEIGHSLGLGHPFNDPENKSWTSKDTIMSYNPSEDGWEYWFSETDLNALKNIWGRENDLGSIDFTKNSFEYKYKKSSDKTYTINTDAGYEDISNITTLNFLDKSIDVQKDIIQVFDLITSVDNIASKIYRLYNGAFGRFPDIDGLNYWVKTNTSKQDTYKKTAISFIASREFIDLYGENSSNENYITNLYGNILNRSPDGEGFNYWLNQINTGIENRGELLMGFAESQENLTIFSNETNVF